MKVDTGWVLRRRRGERDALLEHARAFASGLPPRLDVRAVVVFGSVARGDFNKWSDIDVLVVADGCTGTPLQRHASLDPVPGRIHPVAWTSTEFRERLGRGDPIATEAMAVGSWLHGSPEEVAPATPSASPSATSSNINSRRED